MPTYGFCEPSESPDGLYYKQIGEIDYYNNYDYDEIINEEPEIIKNAFKIEVYELSNGYVTPLYFVKIDEKWHFLIISKCDCGA